MLSDSLGAALSSGAVSDARVKESLRRLYGLRMALGEFDADVVYRDLDKYGRRQLTHPEIAHEAATQALVLLKNGGGGARAALPLAASGLTLAVIGTHAADNHMLKGNCKTVMLSRSGPACRLANVVRADALQTPGTARTRTTWCRRSRGGSGLGPCTTHPARRCAGRTPRALPRRQRPWPRRTRWC